MLQSEGLNDIVEDPVSDYGDEGLSDDDDDLDDILMGTTNNENEGKGLMDLNEVIPLAQSPTNRSMGSSMRSEGKRIRMKASRIEPLYSFGGAPLKRDPVIEAIIESRKLTIVENAYTRLAQMTSQGTRMSQRANPFEIHLSTEENELEVKDRVLSSKHEDRDVLPTESQFDTEGWDDGLSTEQEKETTPIVEKTCVQLYDETCKRLNICPCSMIIRSLNTTSINLRNYGLGSRGCAALAVGLLRNTTVLSLNLSQNNIGNHGMSHIYQILMENSFIEEYDLSFNNLGTKGIAKVAAAVPHCMQVKTLNVAGNELTGSDIQVLLSKLEDNRNLINLNISHNQLEEEGGIIVAKWLSENSILLHFDISWCSLRLTGAKALAKSLGENNRLISLDLSHNSFTNDTIDLLTNSLKKNSTLCELNLRENQFICRYDLTNKENPMNLIKGKDASLFKMILAAATNPPLKIFRLGKNHIDARCLMIILDSLSKIDNITLEELDLTGLTMSMKQIATVEFLFRNHPILTCFVGPVRQTTEHFANILLNLINKYSLEEDISLFDMFHSNFELSNPSATITYTQFLVGLRKAKIPFPVALINDIMKYLSRDNEQGLITLKSLNIV